MPILCLLFLSVLPKITSYIFTYKKSSQMRREYLSRPLSGVGEIEKVLQYPSNTPTHNTSDPYWIQNNLLFNITF